MFQKTVNDWRKELKILTTKNPNLRWYIVIWACIATLLSFAAIPAQAADGDSTFSLRCIAPDTRADGTPLANSALGPECHIYITIDGIQQPGYIASPWGFTTNYTVNLQPKAAPYNIQFNATVVDSDGQESASSVPFLKAFIVQSDAEILISVFDVSIVSCDNCTITDVTGQ